MKLKRESSIPLYEQLKEAIYNQIEQGELQPEQQVPSERELCELYDVSRITVRQALASAVNDGILYRKHGKGTYVAKTKKIHQKLETVSNFESTLAQQGMVASTKIVNAEVKTNNFYISKLLNLGIMSHVVNLQLVGYGDEEPIVYYDSYFPNEIGKDMLQLAKQQQEENKPFSTFDLYQKGAKIAPTHSEQTFESVLSDEKIMNLLELKDVSPIFKITSIIYSDDLPIEYREAYYRGSQYKFFITRDHK